MLSNNNNTHLTASSLAQPGTIKVIEPFLDFNEAGNDGPYAMCLQSMPEAWVRVKVGAQGNQFGDGQSAWICKYLPAIISYLRKLIGMIDDYDESSGWMFLLVPAHPGFPGQIPQSRKAVVVVCVFHTWVLVWVRHFCLYLSFSTVLYLALYIVASNCANLHVIFSFYWLYVLSMLSCMAVFHCLSLSLRSVNDLINEDCFLVSCAPRSWWISMPAPHHSIFMGWMLFLMPNQQSLSTSFITASLFHHWPKTYLFHKAFPTNSYFPSWLQSQSFKKLLVLIHCSCSLLFFVTLTNGKLSWLPTTFNVC